MTDKPQQAPLVNRRAFMGISAATGLTLMTGAWAKGPSQPEPGSRRAWAQQQLRGGEAFILPSFHSDLKTLDEEGLRIDVRHSIAQGFCSILPLPVGIDADTFRSMRDIVSEEAKGKINLVDIIRPTTSLSSIREMEQAGVSHALIYFDPKQATQTAIYEQMRRVAEETSLGLVLYAKPDAAIEKLDPTGLPMEAFDRLADLENVVAVKFTQLLRPASSYAVAECLGDRLLLGVVDLEMMLVLAAKYKMQWTGQWGIDCLQSPERPWVNEFLALLSRQEHRAAYELYWRYESVASEFYKLQAPALRNGGHPWMHIKYMKWLTGGNGGLLPHLNQNATQLPPLDAAARARCRQAFERVGIPVVDLPDEAFVVGNAAWRRGVRAKDMVALPQYIS